MFTLSPAWLGRLLQAQSVSGCLLGSFPSYQQGRAVRSSLHSTFLWSRAWPRSQPQLLHLCWCCLGLPGSFPQTLGMTHSDKHSSGNSRDKWISSQNLGQILPVCIWSFNLWTSAFSDRVSFENNKNNQHTMFPGWKFSAGKGFGFLKQEALGSYKVLHTLSERM